MAEQTYELYIGSATGAQIDAAASKVAAMEETLSGTAATIPSSAAVKNYVDGKAVDTESTLSGNASKIPSSKAVKDVTDTLLSKTDSIATSDKTKKYYIVFNEDNTKVIEGYKYVDGDDSLTASSGDKIYVYENIDFDILNLFGRDIHIAICNELNGTSLVNKVMSNTYSPWYGGNIVSMSSFIEKTLIMCFNQSKDIYSYDIPTNNLLGAAYGEETQVYDLDLMYKAIENNGKYTKIISALNSDGVVPDGFSNKFVNSSEQKNLCGTNYVGKLSLCPSSDYSRSLYSVTFCPNITQLDVDVSENTNITRVKIEMNNSLKKIRIKMNSNQNPQFSSNYSLEEIILEVTCIIYEARAFGTLPALKKLDITRVSSIISLYATFTSSSNLEWLDMSNVPTVMHASGAITDTMMNTPKLTTLIGDHTLAEVENDTITCFTGMKTSFNLSYCPLLSRASLLATIKGVYDFSQDANFDAENTYATLTIGETLMGILEEEDIDILFAKRWDLA